MQKKRNTLLEQEDMNAIRELAKKYRLSVPDLGRSIVRQADKNVRRAIRLTEEEYARILTSATENETNMSRWCTLACRAFIRDKARNSNFPDYTMKNEKRIRRIEVKLTNAADEAELIDFAMEHSMKISTLIRYCALRFDGREIRGYDGR